MAGWIKFHRQILDWEWYSDKNTSRLFFHLLLSVNHKEKNWRGIIIKKGEKITSQDKLSEETGLTRQQIRTSLSKLKSTNDITVTAKTQHTVIYINNWDKYQDNEDDNQQSNQRATNEQPTSNQRITTNKNVKNGNNEKKEDIPAKADVSTKKNIKLTYPDFLLRCKQLGEKKIPEKDGVFKIANDSGIPVEYLKICWREFHDIYKNNDKKKYINWRLTFQNCVRQNWYELWYADHDNIINLTSKGRMAMNRADSND